ncbi:MAG: hypothetical protein H0W45_10165 [Acidobacteria bacterium]|nr:hypothetical protein [Acidobacteriota bacterium]
MDDYRGELLSWIKDNFKFVLAVEILSAKNANYTKIKTKDWALSSILPNSAN